MNLPAAPTFRARVRALVVSRAAQLLRNAGRRSGSFAGKTLLALLSLPFVPRLARTESPRRAVQFLAAAGCHRFSVGFISALGNSAEFERLKLAHEIHVTMGNIKAAKSLAQEKAGPAWNAPETQLLLKADRQFAIGNLSGVVKTLANNANNGPERSSRMLSVFRSQGKPTSTLALLGSADHGIRPSKTAIERFDANWMLGDVDAASEAVSSGSSDLLESIEVIRRIRRLDRFSAVSDEQSLSQILTRAHNCHFKVTPEWLSSVYFEFSLLDEVLELETSTSKLGPAGRYNVARSAYVSRDFARVRRLVPGLLGTRHHWDAEKLEARILLEEGRFSDALAHRQRRGRLRQSFDEVEFFALLHLGRVDEAFAAYLHPPDKVRHKYQFRAPIVSDASSHLPRTRFVIPQNGPGDEILLAASYPSMVDSGIQLSAACDPRLTSILRRSFPDIMFHPSERLTGHRAPGFLGNSTEPRAPGSFFDLLTNAALEAANDSEDVHLGRSVMDAAVANGPNEPYLRPNRAIVGQFETSGPVVGIVWRSEIVDAMRGIHYLTPSDFAPLSDLNCRFVSLQHDATKQERFELSAVFGDRISFPDDVDLRDDFEATAGLVFSLTAVVGVGTTILELSAAVGTSAIALHPNLIGAWRRRQDAGDRWHQSMKVAVADSVLHPASCMTTARRLLSETLADYAGR